MFVALTMAIQTNAMEVLVTDSVETSAQYSNDVYYSLHDGNKKINVANNWDIAFEILGAGYSILTNDGYGVQLYHKSGMTAEDFENTVDLNDVQNNWKQLYNSTETWTVGAFVSNGDPLNDFDLGWGEYSMATHSVFGTTFYVVKTISGEWKKIVIDGLVNRSYLFRIANLDGSNLVEKEIKKNDFLDRNFVYYSIDRDETIDREPMISDWDLHFGKYINMEGENKDTPYPVTGVKTNPKIKSIRVVTDSPSDVAVPDVVNFDGNITNIGSNWKSFNGQKFIVNDSLVFFLYHPEKLTTYRLLFTRFDGSSTGKYIFNKAQIATSVDNENTESGISISVYPSIASSNETVNVLTNMPIGENAVIEIVSAMGQIVYSANYKPENEFGNIQIPTYNFAKGFYMVNIRTQLGRVSQKLIIQ
jgi:hypothetical protein